MSCTILHIGPIAADLGGSRCAPYSPLWLGYIRLHALAIYADKTKISAGKTIINMNLQKLLPLLYLLPKNCKAPSLIE